MCLDGSQRAAGVFEASVRRERRKGLGVRVVVVVAVVANSLTLT